MTIYIKTYSYEDLCIYLQDDTVPYFDRKGYKERICQSGRKVNRSTVDKREIPRTPPTQLIQVQVQRTMTSPSSHPVMIDTSVGQPVDRELMKKFIMKVMIFKAVATAFERLRLDRVLENVTTYK